MAAPGSAWAHNLSNRGGLRQLQGLFLEPCFAVGRSAAMCHANLLCIPKDHEALQLPIPFEKRKTGLQKSVVVFPSPQKHFRLRSAVVYIIRQFTLNLCRRFIIILLLAY